MAEGGNLIIGLSASDPDGNGLTLSATGLPGFAALIDNLNGSGTINVAPGFADAGTYPVTVTVTDDGTGALTDSDSFDLVVSNVNQPPALTAIGNQAVPPQRSDYCVAITWARKKVISV